MTAILWTKKWAEETKKEFKFFKTLKSSNTTAKELKSTSEIPLLLIAQEQTHPYGRKKRKWIPSDFMATWIWQSSYTPTAVFSPLLGLALYNSFQQIWPSDLWSLKAPNDIYLADKKIAGLLLETQIPLNPREGVNPVTSAYNVIPNWTPSSAGMTDNVRIIFGLGINVFKSPPYAECINNHYIVNELLWRKFLDFFWQSLASVKNKNISKMSSDELKHLKQALQNHSQYKDLIQVLEDGSLVFKNKTIHWLDL
ncbi:MAG: hypothetical protein OXK80_02260 [Bdellovibrionales bacterium]|nr:hypothetical protein [Bdellovibrionales bacterium]